MIMSSIADLCKAHGRTSYYDGPNGESELIGVRNRKGMILWYRFVCKSEAYNLTGSTLTPEGATLRNL